eukprot:tig00021127_g18768.t1
MRLKPLPPSIRRIPGVRQVIVVSSAKGGVGKSTVAVNLACALRRYYPRVGILDADIFGPSLPQMLRLPDKKPDVDENKNMIPHEVHGMQCNSMGVLVPKDSPMIWRGPMVMSAVEQLFFKTAWKDIDVLVVDMPPGTGDTQLTLAQKVPVAGAVIVSTPQDVALIDAVRGAHMFRKVNVPILGLVENMSMFHCPSCGHESAIFGSGGAQAKAAELGIDFLGRIPISTEIRVHADEGRPIVLERPEGPEAAVYLDVAHRVYAKLTDPAFIAANPTQLP